MSLRPKVKLQLQEEDCNLTQRSNIDQGAVYKNTVFEELVCLEIQTFETFLIGFEIIFHVL